MVPLYFIIQFGSNHFNILIANTDVTAPEIFLVYMRFEISNLDIVGDWKLKKSIGLFRPIY